MYILFFQENESSPLRESNLTVERVDEEKEKFTDRRRTSRGNLWVVHAIAHNLHTIKSHKKIMGH